jgi:hypothetical protein
LWSCTSCKSGGLLACRRIFAHRYARFPETKGRTLEEIGILFGDEHVASQWYGLTEKEKGDIRSEAAMVREDEKRTHPSQDKADF